MICFHLDGSVQIKENLCSCCTCLNGDFVNCLSERGKIVYGAVSSGDDTDASSEDEIEDEIVSSAQQQEEYNIRGSNIMECISKDSVIALFSPSSSLELFYLCHVYDFGIAQDLFLSLSCVRFWHCTRKYEGW